MDHRGRSRRDDYYEDTYRPRHRSLGRQAIDKLEDAMDSLKLDHRGTNALEVIPYHAGREVRRSSSHHRYRPPSHHRHSSSHHHRHHSPSRHNHDHHRHHSPSHSHHVHDHHRHRHDHNYTPRRYHSSSPTRHHSTRHHNSSPTRHHTTRLRSRSRPLTHGLQASVEAAAIEAYRLRNEPGGWKGAKAGRVATAALSAGLIGAAAERRRERRYGDDGGGEKGALGAAVGGLAVNRLVNGGRGGVR